MKMTSETQDNQAEALIMALWLHR